MVFSLRPKPEIIIKTILITILTVLLSYSSLAQKTPCKIKLKNDSKSFIEWYDPSTIQAMNSKGYELLDKDAELNDDEADYISFYKLSSSGFPRPRGSRHASFELVNSHTKNEVINIHVKSKRKLKGVKDKFAPLMKKMTKKLNRKLLKKLPKCPLL